MKSRVKIDNVKDLDWLKKFLFKNGFEIAFEDSITPFSVVLDYDKKNATNAEEIISIAELKKFCQIKMSFEIGDKVRIIDTGKMYSTYTKWFADNNINPEIAARYRYDDEDRDDWLRNQVGKIVALGPHSRVDNSTLYCVEFNNGLIRPIYLIDERGIVEV